MNLNQIFLSDLRNIGFSGDIATQKSVTVTYATDNSIYEVEPDGVIFPRSENDVELIFNLLRQEKFREIKITARGGGTSTNGQSINSGFIVDYSRYMNRILKIDEKAMTAEVEPGVILDVLNRELEKFNLYFPPNISPSNRATIGGMVNTDACGKGSCTHGRTSDNIENLTLHLLADENVIVEKTAEILSRAQNLYSSKHLARTATGYNIEKSFAQQKVDLNYLISGSEGTLALVSKITVKLKKLPAKKRVVLLRYQNFDAALQDARNVIALCPTAIETIDENVIRLARNDIIWQDVGHLIGDGVDTSVNILEFSYDSVAEFEQHEDFLNRRLSEGRTEFVTPSSRSFQNDMNVENGLQTHSRQEGDFLFENYFLINDKTEIANIWNLRKQGVGLLGAMKGKRRPLPFVEDTIVPPEELAAYISGFRAILKKYGVVYGMFGHVDAGCLHVRPALNMRQKSDRELIRKISDEVCELLLKHRGIIWGEHGKGFRSEYSEKFLGVEVTKIFKEIKKTFDPFDQLNSGKIASANGEIAALDAISTRGKFDENISPKMHDEFENILSCNGNALCFNLDKSSAMCPSYKASGDRRFSPKGRAMLFKEWVRKPANKILEKEIYESFSKCLGCKACNTQCPIKVSIPDAKAYFLSHYFKNNWRKPQDYLIGNIEFLLLIFGRVPLLFNLLTQNFLTKFFVRRIFGVMDVPVILNEVKDLVSQTPIGRTEFVTPSSRSFQDDMNVGNGLQTHSRHENIIYLLRDAYTNYFHGEELQNTYELLTKLGFDVRFTKVFENGKALHAKGFLNRFRKVVAANISYLKQLDGILISVDPSVALSYRDEYRRFNDDKIEVFYLPEFLQKISPQKSASSDKKYHLILHCSEQTNVGRIAEIWSEIFAKFGVKLNTIKTGCCGMSGSFGMEEQNFETSKKLFEMNWQEQVEKLGQDSNNVIMVSGSSCKSQMERFGEVVVSSPVAVLNRI